MESLEHPDITAMERDGYISEPMVACTCSVCGEPIYYNERALHLKGYGWVCMSCVEDYVEEVT